MINMLQSFQNFFSVSKGERDFKKFIKEKSESHFNDFPKGNVILVEGNQTSTNLIALTTLLPALKRRYQANVRCYFMEPNKTILQKIKNRVKFQSSILKKISSNGILFVNDLAPRTPQLKKYVESLDFLTMTKRDFENLHYRGILIGDLIYDNYLRKTKQLTLELRDPELINYLVETCKYLDRFLDFVTRNEVKAIVVTHMVYNFAIPARVALTFGIDVYLCNAEVLYRVTQNNYYAFDTHKNYPQLFSSIEKSRASQYLSQAELGLKSRLMGDLSDLPYFYTPLAPVSCNLESLEKIGGAQFLVALHDFSDSPHFFGICLFPDFYEWLKAIGEFSLENDVVFLVKQHPNSLFNQVEAIMRVIEEYPKLILLDSNVSNYELGQMHLNGCLTVYGTIAHEMAYMGVPVVNACLNNPHASYSFCYSPRSVAEWHEIVKELAKTKRQVESTEVLEYYAMNYLYHPISWMIENYSHFITRVGSYREPDPDKTFRALEEPDFSYGFDSLQQSIQNFLESQDLRFGKVHMAASIS